MKATHVCMVKYGYTVQGMDANELVHSTCDAIRDNSENTKFHILTDTPNTAPEYANTYQFPPEDIAHHEHWSKIFFFDPKYIRGVKKGDETIILDIDMEWIEPWDVIEWEVGDDEFVSTDRWWRDNDCLISGNFYKFKSHNWKHVYDTYMEDVAHHRMKYYENGTVSVMGHGEQYFVWDQVKDDVVLQPPDWCMKHHPDKYDLYAARYKERTGGDYFEDFHNAKWQYYNIRP